MVDFTTVCYLLNISVLSLTSCIFGELTAACIKPSVCIPENTLFASSQLENARRSQFGNIPKTQRNFLIPKKKKIKRIQDFPGTKLDRHTAPVHYIKGLELPLALSKQKSHRSYAATVWSHPNQPWVVLSITFICFTFCCHMNN